MVLWGSSIYYLLFFSGFMSFIFFHYHYLLLLLSIEAMMLSIYFSLSMLYYMGGGFPLILMFLVGLVCESCIGIIIMVCYVRANGVEMFSFYY